MATALGLVVGFVVALVAGKVSGTPADLFVAVVSGVCAGGAAGLCLMVGNRRALTVGCYAGVSAAVVSGLGTAVGLAPGISATVGFLSSLIAGPAADQAYLRSADVARRLGPDALTQVAGGLARGAACLAGPRRVLDEETWLADLRSAPEVGRPLPAGRQLKYACSLLLGAVRMRAGDLIVSAGHRLAWVLASDKRTAAAIGGLLAAEASYLLATQGLLGLITNTGNIVAAGAGLYAAARLLR